jgi:transcriptional regulator with XRE-family HTH domain
MRGEKMRCFRNIAELIKTRRLSHPKKYSQSELSNLLGYKNGQFISNVERALCNIPLKMLSRVSEVLDIPATELKAAILRDQEETLNNYLQIATGEVRSKTELKSVSDQAESYDYASSTHSTFKMSSNS